MAKKKKRGRRQGMFSKLINVALTALAMAGPIQIWLGTHSIASKVDLTLQAFTGYSMVAKNFKLERLAIGWAPVATAVGVGTALHYVRKKFPVR